MTHTKNPSNGPSGARLEALLQGLPTLPTVLTRLMQLDRSSDAFFDDLVELLGSDPPIALRFLRLANSAVYGPEEPILSLPRAVSRVGTEAIVEEVASIAVTEVFVPTSDRQCELWTHAIQTAVGCRQLALARPGVAPELAYVAGLLHDLGRFVMFRIDPRELRKVNDLDWHTPQGLLDAEHELCGYDHAELGGRACETWELPSTLCDVVRYHHEMQLASVSGLDEPARRLLPLLTVADSLSMLLLSEPRFRDASPALRHSILERRCLHYFQTPVDADEVDAIVDTVVEEGGAILARLGLALPPRDEMLSA